MNANKENPNKKWLAHPLEYPNWVLLFLFLLMSSYMILFRSIETVVAFSVIDDGMYYPKIALNLVSRGILSYDGITMTNGFHPLWMILLIPLYYIVSDPMTALHFSFVYIFLILIVACFLLIGICRYLKLSTSGTFVAFFIIILNLRFFTIYYSMLESHVVLVIYLTYLYYSFSVAEKRFTEPIYAFINGLLIGFCFLARLDSGLLAAGYGLVLVYRFATKQQLWATFWRSVFWSSLGFLILAAPYVWLNIHYFGHVESVPMYMKSRAISFEFLNTIFNMFSEQLVPRILYVFKLDWLPVSVVVAVMCASAFAIIVGCFYTLKRRNFYGLFKPIIDFCVFVVIDLALVSLMAPQEIIVSAWYMIPQIVLVGLLLGASVPDVKILRLRVIPSAIVILVLLQVWAYPYYLERKKMTFAKFQVADFIRNHLPENIRGCMYDSGIVSYFSQRDFVSLNGFVGDYQLADLAKTKRLRRLVEKYGVGYLVIDVLDDFLPELNKQILFKSDIKIKFADFREPPKHLVVYRISPADIERIWDQRYDLRPTVSD